VARENFRSTVRRIKASSFFFGQRAILCTALKWYSNWLILMADPEQLAIIKQGVAAWNQWRMRVAVEGPDLNGADLRGADLREANLFRVDLRESNLSTAIFICADLRGADLRAANLREADLRAADLSDAFLLDANLSGTFLSKTDFHKADLGWTVFGQVDLSKTIGLDDMHHLGPSTIGIDTIYLSRGLIPEAFLRGAGVPDTFITFARSLAGKAIAFYSCFISYSAKDQQFADRLYADLQEKKLRVWYAPEDLKIGDRFPERIEESIRLHDKVMIVLSEASVQSSWVEREVNAAREREEREDRLVLIPIRIDDAVMNAPQHWAADIRRSRHIGDFRSWKNQDSYQKAFQRLLRDLALEAEPA
jgi:uncharacterized protein YjbI with pentapeptide repeats